MKRVSETVRAFVMPKNRKRGYKAYEKQNGYRNHLHGSCGSGYIWRSSVSQPLKD